MIEISSKRKLKHIPVNTKTVKFVHYLIFDVETKLIKVSKTKTKHEPFLICYQYLKLYSSGQYEKSKVEYVTTVKEFYQVIDYYLSQFHYITILAHNTTFDISVIDIFSYLHDNDFSCQVYNPARNAFYLRFVKDGYAITFIDNLNFFSGKLATLGKELGFKKLEMPKTAKLSKAFIRYCKRDVEIVTKGLIELSKICGKWDCGALSITRAKLAFNIYCKAFLHEFIQLHNDRKTLELEFKSYYGGRTEMFYFGKHTKGMKYYVDFNSHYPSCMINNKFSIKHRLNFSNISKSQLKNYFLRFNVTAKVKIKTDKPIYPLKTNEGIIFPIGTFTTYLSHYELLEALKRDHIKKIYSGACYHRKVIFNEYVEYFHKLKQKHKQKGNKIITYFCKLMLNSLYGKFGQKLPELVLTDQISDKRYDIILVKDFKEKRFYRKKVINYQVFKETEKQVSPLSVPVIASEITSLARLRLYLMIEKAGIENVFYMDTDSLITNKKGYDNLKSEIKDNTLGKLELEHKSTRLEINALKDYSFGKLIRHKGIPTKAKKKSKKKYQFEHFSTITEFLSNNESSYYFHELREKNIKHQIKKGLKLPSNRIVAWNLTE